MNTSPHFQRFNKRDGVTLLFVMSMVVLFLLMGTTFMVVSNNFYRDARRRAVVSTNIIEPEKLLDRCFYDLVRGPSLRDSGSPLRGHSILEDQYGYGYRALAADDGTAGATPPIAAPTTPTSPFVNLFLDVSPSMLRRTLVLGFAGIDIEDQTTPEGQAYVDGVFGGRVLSIVSGNLKGYSGRIIFNQFIPNGTAKADNRLQITLLREGFNWQSLQTGDQIVINGREFSGTGAGGILAGLTLSMPDVEGSLSPIAARPNRLGETYDASTVSPSLPAGKTSLISPTGYLNGDRSPNEPWDVADYQNMFLSTTIRDATGTPTSIIPSFHRDTLYMDQFAAGSQEQIREFSFRPTFVTLPPNAPDVPEDYSTANVNFPSKFGTDGTFPTAPPALATANSFARLDVDADNDGILDSVWIDIGLPNQTDSDGNVFRPLVAYRVIDMDGRLNVNAHGSYADLSIQTAINDRTKPVTSRGGGYGVAEISLGGLFTGVGIPNYETLLESRYSDVLFPTGADALPGSEASDYNSFDEDQKMFGYPAGADSAISGELFRTGGDLFAQSEVQTVGFVPGTTTNALNVNLPGFPTPSAFDATTAPAVEFFTDIKQVASPYLVNFGETSGSGDSLFSAGELEAILRPLDSDSLDLPNRLSDLVAAGSPVTTHSFEVAVPASPLSIMERTLGVIPGTTTLSMKNMIALSLAPRDALLGKKLDVNRPLGNGMDNDGDGVIDNNPSAMPQNSSQYNGPVLNLDNDATNPPATGDDLAKQLLAKDLYMTAILACGVDPPGGTGPPPVDFPTAGSMLSAAERAAVYYQMLAQWAVNVVDFRDPDSIMTRFNYDTPDAMGEFTAVWAPPTANVVYGVERPELLINETFAYHDRRSEDGGDPIWVSGQVPQSGAFFELYHPWTQGSGALAESLPAELDVAGGGTGVDLGQLTPTGDPVWRISIKRNKTDVDGAGNDQFLRAIYFAEVTAAMHARPAVRSGLASTDDYFFTTLASKTVEPGEYAVIGSSGNVGLRAGRYETTFGRLQPTIPPVPPNLAPPVATAAEITSTRAIGLDVANDTVIRRNGAGNETTVDAKVIVIDSSSVADVALVFQTGSRSLSLSDPNKGYEEKIPATSSVFGAGDGQHVFPALDEPLDKEPTLITMDDNRQTEDYTAINTNGTTDNFRFVYLQRLANPLLPYSAALNPYITIDTAGVDLLSFNGMVNNMDNTVDNGEPDVTIGTTELRSAERGESFVDVATARRNLFTSEDGNVTFTAVAGPLADGHNLSLPFNETFGKINDSHSAAGVGFTPMGWLTWNDRPYANVAELANVPFVSAEALTYNFNFGSTSAEPQSPEMETENQLVEYFGRTDGGSPFRHLLRFGQDSGPVGGALLPTNRMVNLFEFLEVPNRFLGSETFLHVDGATSMVDDGGVFPSFQPPFHSVPNFRTPGKVNLNTIESPLVWTSLFGGTTAPDFTTAFLPLRNATAGPTDFNGFFAPPEAGEFTLVAQAAKGADKTLFRNVDPTIPGGVFDGAAGASPTRDPTGSAYFNNELRLKMGAVTTTRSSVFAIWITTGYFAVDGNGRLGAEIGSDVGRVRRNRGFYMIDRSIPVAFEPGVNHNVDDIVLLKTFIE